MLINKRAWPFGTLCRKPFEGIYRDPDLTVTQEEMNWVYVDIHSKAVCPIDLADGLHVMTVDYLGENTLDRVAGPRILDFRKSAWPGTISSATGLSSAEQWGTWSLGGSAMLEFSTPLPNRFAVHLVAHAFGPNVGKEFCRPRWG